MGRAIGQIIPLAAGVALSPLPIIAVILLLTGPRGRGSGMSFLAGWLLGLATVGTLVLLAADGANAGGSGAPAVWAGVVLIALGVLLAIVGVRQWRGRPAEGESQELPGWMRTVESFTAPKAAAVAVGFAAAKPKNLLLTAGAATAIAQTGTGASQQAGAMATFVVLASVGVASPVAVSLLMGDRAAGMLERMRDWLVRENQTIIAVICILIAAKLIGDGITGLSS